MSEDQEKLVEAATVTLTKAELQFVRDLFGILLPPDGQVTISESLASTTGRKILEKKLWAKFYNKCVEFKVAVGDNVPDYIIVTTSQPEMAIGMLQHDTGEEGPTIKHTEEGLSKLFDSETGDSEEPKEEGDDE